MGRLPELPTFSNMKKCSICNIEKELKDFVKRNNRKSGRQPYCKKCHNERRKSEYCSNRMKDYDLKKNYGISLSDYDEMFVNQNGSCAICLTHISNINHKHKKHLCVDHCHDSGDVRGLLCDSCNRGLGLFKDSKEILERAIKYLG